MLGCLDLGRDGEGGRISSSSKEMELLNKKEKGFIYRGLGEVKGLTYLVSINGHSRLG